MAHASDRRVAASALGLEISAAAYHLTQAVADYLRYRATLRELARLDADALADLGLHRSGLRAAAREAVYGRQ